MTKGELFALALVVCLMSACLSLFTPAEHAPSAVEIRLIGECDGKFYGAMEESDFPDGCAWIEPIRYDVE